ncbi:hypothetical protein GCM10010238_47000 [Streptomyces griseoviridis]|uniref:Uncharacterized protein n=1 Tax=Streptomyces griseoviridis TaxID=45398 RepID=A0A918GPB5_STRGD|nr:hypothetical protein GCM10010238_47000 [Streptomyces niveoruber]
MRGRPSWVIGGCLALPRIVPADDQALRTPGFAVPGTPPALPAGTHLTAYRIVQEALANTLKHAVRTRVRARPRPGTSAGSAHHPDLRRRPGRPRALTTGERGGPARRRSRSGGHA